LKMKYMTIFFILWAFLCSFAVTFTFHPQHHLDALQNCLTDSGTKRDLNSLAGYTTQPLTLYYTNKGVRSVSHHVA
jgi:hypothetical protein